MRSSARGQVVVVSGPSGAGKSTLLARVFARCGAGLKASVSATTRDPRPGEIDGRHYHFLSPVEFHRRRAAGEFLECFEVFGQGDWYGTLRAEVAPSLEQGKSVVLEIDVRGARAVVEQYPHALTIFVRPSSLEELERRLRERGTESPEALARRLEAARQELEFASTYRHQVVNDDLDRAVAEVCELLTASAAP